jgi:hypothetical protein
MPRCVGGIAMRATSKPSIRQKAQTVSEKHEKEKMEEGLAPMVECLPTKHEFLSSNIRIT